MPSQIGKQSFEMQVGIAERGNIPVGKLQEFPHLGMVVRHPEGMMGRQGQRPEHEGPRRSLKIFQARAQEAPAAAPPKPKGGQDWKVRKELDRLERRLEKLSGQEAELHERLAAHATDFVKLQELDGRLKEIQADLFESFKALVRTRRRDKLKAPETELFTGAVWSGRRAEEMGLIDGLGEMRQILRARYGEKVRLVMARMLYDPPNFLVLDEPTNHLDLATKAMLIRALADYEGTLLLVSHDRHFLSALTNRVLELDGSTPRVYGAGYADYVGASGHEAPGMRAPG